MEIVFLGLLFGVFSAVLASGKNRSAAGWFFIGLLFGPFGLLVGLMDKISPEEEETEAGSKTVKDRQTVIAATDADEAWHTTKSQLNGVMSARRFEHVSVDNDRVYMLKKDALDSAYVIIERKDGAIYMEVFNTDDVVLPIAETYQRQQEAEEAQSGADAQSMSIANELEKLHALQQRGVLTEQEFAAQKAKLIHG